MAYEDTHAVWDFGHGNIGDAHGVVLDQGFVGGILKGGLRVEEDVGYRVPEGADGYSDQATEVSIPL